MSITDDAREALAEIRSEIEKLLAIKSSEFISITITNCDFNKGVVPDGVVGNDSHRKLTIPSGRYEVVVHDDGEITFDSEGVVMNRVAWTRVGEP